MDNRPRGRQKNVTGAGKPIQKRGEGLNTGPVGRQDGYAGRPGSAGQTGGQHGGAPVRTTRKGSMSLIAIIAALVLGGGGLGLNSILGGSGTELSYTDNSSSYSSSYSPAASSSGSSSSIGSSSAGSSDDMGGYDITSLLSGMMGGSTASYTPSAGSTSSGWASSAPPPVMTMPDPSRLP